MQSGVDATELTIFIHESLRQGGKPLYEEILARARREGMAGATIFRGIEGYGVHRHLHSTRLLDVSDDLPVLIEIVDRPERIARFLDAIAPLIPHGTATLNPVTVVTYRGRSE